jgi:hypothetical protein
MTGLATTTDTKWGAVSAPLKTSALGTIGICCIVAPGNRVTTVFGTRVIVIAVGDGILAATAIARIICARNAVIAVRAGRALSLFAVALHTDTGSAVPVAGAARVDDDFAKVRMQRALVGTRVLARPVGAFILVVVGAVLVCPALRLLSKTKPICTDADQTAPFAGISVEGRSGCVSHGNTRTRHFLTEIQTAFVLVVTILIPLAFRRTAPYERHHAQRADT